MPTPFLLHHYDMSPFAHKARLMLGFKGLPWHSVQIPVVMPKPDVIALTGGYRRTPLLQRGADVWCDTALIARVLEAEQPRPSLFPTSAPLAPMLAQWIDTTLFWTMIPYAMQPAGLAGLLAGQSPDDMKRFGADRAAFSGMLARPRAPDAAVLLAQALAGFEQQLADGRAWLFGAEASIADFSLAHNLWFVRAAGPMAAILEPHRRLAAWLDRLLAFARPPAAEVTGADAVLQAAAASGPLPTQVLPGLGYEAGQAVEVSAMDYGVDPSPGTLVGLSGDEIVIERHDERAGTVHVHFPRAGFRIARAKGAA